MVVERLPAPALFFHDPRACLRIGQGPLDDPVLEQLVDKVLEPVSEVAPSPAGVEPADAVEHLQDGDGGEAKALVGNRIEKSPDPRLGPRSHHFGDDIRVYKLRERCSHSSSSRENDSGW